MVTAAGQLSTGPRARARARLATGGLRRRRRQRWRVQICQSDHAMAVLQTVQNGEEAILATRYQSDDIQATTIALRRRRHDWAARRDASVAGLSGQAGRNGSSQLGMAGCPCVWFFWRNRHRIVRPSGDVQARLLQTEGEKWWSPPQGRDWVCLFVSQPSASMQTTDTVAPNMSGPDYRGRIDSCRMSWYPRVRTAQLTGGQGCDDLLFFPSCCFPVRPVRSCPSSQSLQAIDDRSLK